ncbi:hypothetical protein B484DRAFT_448223, partial [Ochromonadaceae sp. CCMP2298]
MRFVILQFLFLLGGDAFRMFNSFTGRRVTTRDVRMQADGRGDETNYNQESRSSAPRRYDTCKVLISGVVGMDAKERYMSNGHYVINFSLGVIGHFTAAHDWEKFKPTETMWMPAEMFDDVAKAALLTLRKGSEVHAAGYLIHNKWVDKASGEERKQFRLRVSKLLNVDEFQAVQDIFETVDSSRSKGAGGTYNADSGFASEPPSMDDQTSDSSAGRGPTPGTSSGAWYGNGAGSGTVGDAEHSGYQKPWVPAVAGEKAWKKAASPSSPAPASAAPARAGSAYTRPSPAAPAAPVSAGSPSPGTSVTTIASPSAPATATNAGTSESENSWDTVDDSMPWWD